MALCNEALSQTLCLVWMLEMMSCSNNGLFLLVHIVKLSNSWTTEVHVLLLRSTRLRESRLMSSEISAAGADIHPNIKNSEGKGETITQKSNNTPLQITSIKFKDTDHASAMHNSFDKRERRKRHPEVKVYDWRKTITVNR